MLKTVFTYYPKTVYKFGNLLNHKNPIVTFRRSSSNFHSSPQTVNFRKMKVRILPALQDNYMYLIIDERTKIAAVVDPVEPDTVVEAVRSENVTLTTVLTTHHHWDHAGGNKKICNMFPDLQVFGGDKRIEALTKLIDNNDVIKVGDLTVRCIYTPCHTKGHICYLVQLTGEPSAVFTGDTLFSAGCGRFFEGTAEQMYSALIEKLSALRDNTKVFCGHEYTVANLKFAVMVDPNNKEILKKLKWAETQRENNLPTIPSTIGEEKVINPFMRVNSEGIRAFTKKSDPILSMKMLRDSKDNFKSSRLKRNKLHM